MQQDIPEKWVHWKLTSDPQAAAAFGFRVFPAIAPQGATRAANGGVLTFAIFKRISVQRDTRSLGIGPEDEAVACTLSVDTYAESYAAARDAANVVTFVLHGATESTWGNIVLYSLLKSEQDDIVVPVDGKEMPLYAVGQTYEIRVASRV